MIEAVNDVSETLQSSTIDIVNAQQQVCALSKELQRLRDDSVFTTATEKVSELAMKMGIDAELPAERQRKIPRRLDDNAGNAANQSPKATGNSRSGIPGNRGPPNFRREFPGISEILAGITGNFAIFVFFPIFIVDYDILVFNLTAF